MVYAADRCKHDNCPVLLVKTQVANASALAPSNEVPRTLVTPTQARPEPPEPVSLTSQMHSRVRKFVALFVLIWALGDLSMPGLCRTDLPDFGAPQSTSVSAQPSVSHQQQSQSSVEDDCFCCCPHVAPASPVSLSATAITLADWPAYVTEKPREFSSSLYHPPRS